VEVTWVPEWRKYFDKGERAVGQRLESAVQTQGMAEAIVAAMMTRSGAQRLGAHAFGLLGSVSTTVLHLVNLPSARDVKAIRKEIVELRIQLREMSHRLDEPRRSRRRDG
jgi:hypothetical protein